MTWTSGQRDREIRTRIDCRDRTAREALATILPICLEAHVRGSRPVVVVHNLELLPDSVTRLLKGLERLAHELDATIVLEDSSGLADAFRAALYGGRAGA
jgi:hypothetical protein